MMLYFAYSLEYNALIYTVKYTPQFESWLSSIKDPMTKIRLNRRLDRLSLGIFGDHAPVGESVFELREHFGSGWRMYYSVSGQELIIMLGGGNKASQNKDIEKALSQSKELE
jgi:putative addiction module killer protein